MSHPTPHAAVPGSPTDEHRITLEPGSGAVQVRLGNVLLAETDRATLLLERGCPPRWYLPREDVRMELLRRSETTTVCPFKGQATYWSFEPAEAAGVDVAWSYEDPVAEMAAIRGLVCFWAERTSTALGDAQR